MIDENETHSQREDVPSKPQVVRRRADAAVPEAVAEYKRILKAVLDVRPSGFRRKLAVAMGRNPSFVSQIINPTYPVPIPAAHVETILDVCHLSVEERRAFMAAYSRAHPRRIRSEPGDRRTGRRLILTVPEFGSDHANRQFDTALDDFVRRLSSLCRPSTTD